jgi:hypothetical protein
MGNQRGQTMVSHRDRGVVEPASGGAGKSVSESAVTRVILPQAAPANQRSEVTFFPQLTAIANM